MADIIPADTTDDEILVRQFIAGNNRDPFTTLVVRHKVVMRRILYSVLNGNKEDMEDAEQEILISLFKSLENFKFKSSFKTYFYRLCRNKAIDQVRKKARERRIITEIVLQPAETPVDPEEEVIKREEKREFLKLLNELKEEERSMIILKDVQGLSVKELSQVFKMPEGTVKSRLHRIREKVVNLIRREGL